MDVSPTKEARFINVLRKPKQNRKEFEIEVLKEVAMTQRFWKDVSSKFPFEIVEKLLSEVRILEYDKSQVIQEIGQHVDSFFTIISGLCYQLGSDSAGPTPKYAEATLSHQEKIDLIEILKENPGLQFLGVLREFDFFGQVTQRDAKQSNQIKVISSPNTVLSFLRGSAFSRITGVSNVLFKQQEKYLDSLNDENRDFLRTYPFLAEWSNSHLSNLLSKTIIRTYTKDCIVFKELDLAEFVYLIKSGEFEIRKKISVTSDVDQIQPIDEFRNDLKEFYKNVQDLNVQFARNLKQSQFKILRLAMVGPGESFGMREITENMNKRETEVICRSQTAEVFLLEKQIYMNSISNKHCKKNQLDNLNSDSSVRESWRQKHLAVSQELFNNKVIRKFSIQTSLQPNPYTKTISNISLESPAATVGNFPKSKEISIQRQRFFQTQQTSSLNSIQETYLNSYKVLQQNQFSTSSKLDRSLSPALEQQFEEKQQKTEDQQQQRKREHSGIKRAVSKLFHHQSKVILEESNTNMQSLADFQQFFDESAPGSRTTSQRRIVSKAFINLNTSIEIQRRQSVKQFQPQKRNTDASDKPSLPASFSSGNLTVAQAIQAITSSNKQRHRKNRKAQGNNLVEVVKLSAGSLKENNLQKPISSEAGGPESELQVMINQNQPHLKSQKINQIEMLLQKEQEEKNKKKGHGDNQNIPFDNQVFQQNKIRVLSGLRSKENENLKRKVRESLARNQKDSSDVQKVLSKESLSAQSLKCFSSSFKNSEIIQKQIIEQESLTKREHFNAILSTLKRADIVEKIKDNVKKEKDEFNKSQPYGEHASSPQTPLIQQAVLFFPKRSQKILTETQSVKNIFGSSRNSRKDLRPGTAAPTSINNFFKLTETYLQSPRLQSPSTEKPKTQVQSSQTFENIISTGISSDNLRMATDQSHHNIIKNTKATIELQNLLHPQKRKEFYPFKKQFNKVGPDPEHVFSPIQTRTTNQPTTSSKVASNSMRSTYYASSKKDKTFDEDDLYQINSIQGTITAAVLNSASVNDLEHEEHEETDYNFVTDGTIQKQKGESPQSELKRIQKQKPKRNLVIQIESGEIDDTQPCKDLDSSVQNPSKEVHQTSLSRKNINTTTSSNSIILQKPRTVASSPSNRPQSGQNRGFSNLLLKHSFTANNKLDNTPSVQNQNQSLDVTKMKRQLLNELLNRQKPTSATPQIQKNQLNNNSFTPKSINSSLFTAYSSPRSIIFEKSFKPHCFSPYNQPSSKY